MMMGVMLGSSAMAATLTWTWDTTDQLNKSIVVKTNGATTIYWGDGSSNSVVASPSSSLTLTHTYATAGNYIVTFADDVVTNLDCHGNKITNLDTSGYTSLSELVCDDNSLTALNISGATALTFLNCSFNQLTTLDVSGAKVIDVLYCNNNALNSLNISGAIALTFLNCSVNQLTALDVSQNTALVELYCNNNGLTSLDVSQNIALTNLWCQRNQLTSLDVSQNTALLELYCHSNQLTSLDISHNTALTKLCCVQSTMTNLYLNSTQMEMAISDEASGCNPISTANTIHKHANTTASLAPSGAIIWRWDTTGQLEKSVSVRTNAATTINWGDGTSETIAASASDLTLTHTYASAGNYTVTIADNVVTKLDCSNDQEGEGVLELNVAEATALTYLDCGYNQLLTLDISNNTALTHLDCSNNELSSLNVASNTALTYLDCGYNQLTALDVASNSNLTHLGCYSNQLTSLNVANNTNLTFLDCSKNSLSTIDVTANTALTHLDVAANTLSTIDASHNTALVKFYCGSNQLTTLDVRPNTNLSVLCCAQASLTDLYITAEQNANLTVVEEDELCVEERENVIHKYSTTAITPDSSTVTGVILFTWDTTDDLTKKIVVQSTAETTINWGDGTIETIPVSAEDLTLTHTYSAAGMYTVGIANNVLTKFDCCTDEVGEKLLSLDVSAATALTYLDCGYSQLTTLDVSANTNLTYLSCHNNQLTSLNVANNTALTYLDCSRNSLSTIDVSANTALTHLDVASNNLSTINVTANTALVNFYCGYNQLTTLDVRQNTNLSILCCAQSSLTDLYITAEQNANLTVVEENSICVEESENVIHKYPSTVIRADITGVILFTWDATDDLTKTIVVQSTAETTISWGDGTTETISASAEDLTLTHTYSAAATYTVVIVDNVLTKLDCCTDEVGEKLLSLDVSAATALTYLDCGYGQLTTLDVSANTNLTYLSCHNNQLTSLNVANNTALTYLDCSRNSLSTIDVSANTALTHLDVASNNLSTINVTANTALVNFYCGYNQLTTLDVRQNTNLSILCCAQSSLTDLYITATQNANLSIVEENSICVEESQNVIHKYPTTVIRAEVTGVILLSWIATDDLTKTIVVQSTAETTISWGDGTIEAISASAEDLTLTHTYSAAGTYSVGIADNVLTKLDCCTDEVGEKITSLNVSAATALTYLDCGYSQLTSLDVSANTNLTYLACNDNQLTSLNISNNTALTFLDCSRNSLSTIDVTLNTALTHLDVAANNLTVIDITHNTSLVKAYCGYNQLTTLDIRQNSNLSVLCCAQASLTELYMTADQYMNLTVVEETDVCIEERDNVIHKYATTVLVPDGGIPKAITWEWNITADALTVSVTVKTTAETTIEWGDETSETIVASETETVLTHEYTTAGSYTASISDNVVTILKILDIDVSSLDVTRATALTDLRCGVGAAVGFGSMTSLDVTNNTALTRLECYGNEISTIDLSNNTELQYLSVGRNALTSLDLSNNTKLIDIGCHNNNLTTLDLSANTALLYVYCGNNQLTELDITANTALTKLCATQASLEKIYVTSAQRALAVVNETEACWNVADNTIHKYPTTVVMERNSTDAIVWVWDTTGQLTKTITVKTSAATTINWGDGTIEAVAASTSNLTLTHTYATAGNYAVSITDNVVTKVDANGNQISNADVTKAIVLKYLNFESNLLTSLDISQNTALIDLNFKFNSISSLDISKNTALALLWGGGNQLTELDVSKNTELTKLSVFDNQINSLDVSKNLNLVRLYVSDNNLSTLDISKNTALTELGCSGNNLTSLDVSPHSALTILYCGENQLTTLDISKNSALNKLCCVQSTLTTLTLDEIQMDGMTILNETTACDSIDTDATIHKYPTTVLNVIGVAIKIQPSAVAMSGMKLTTAYTKAKNMLSDPVYGISATGSSILQSHMMKNTEWGAVAYLTNAIGRNPWRNNNKHFTGFSASSVDGQTEEYGFAWNTAYGVKASTTHNVFGVYDMNGGREEYVAAYVTDRGAAEIITDATQTKDVDKYTEISDTMNYKGGALSETGNFTEGKSWNGTVMFDDGTSPYFVRGGWYYKTDGNSSKDDMYQSYSSTGKNSSNWSGFRPVIIVKK